MISVRSKFRESSTVGVNILSRTMEINEILNLSCPREVIAD